MFTSDQRMIDTQARLITKLNETVREKNSRIDILAVELAKYRAAGVVWLDLQEQVISNPTLQSEWDRFLAILRMAADEDYLKQYYHDRGKHGDAAVG